MMDERTLLDFFWTAEYRQTSTAITKLEKARTFYNIPPIEFVLKKKVIYKMLEDE